MGDCEESSPGDGSAVLDPADLHASPGQGPQGGLGAGSGGLGAVSTWVEVGLAVGVDGAN